MIQLLAVDSLANALIVLKGGKCPLDPSDQPASTIEAAVEIAHLTAELEKMRGQLAATNIELESLKRSRMLKLGKLLRGIAAFKHE